MYHVPHIFTATGNSTRIYSLSCMGPAFTGSVSVPCQTKTCLKHFTNQHLSNKMFVVLKNAIFDHLPWFRTTSIIIHTVVTAISRQEQFCYAAHLMEQ